MSAHGSPAAAPAVVGEEAAPATVAVNTFVPAIVLACPCEIVRLRDVPDAIFDDCDDPESVRAFLANKPWKHDTLDGYYSTTERFLRVTKRGTMIFTMPRDDQPYNSIKAARARKEARERALDEIAENTSMLSRSVAEAVLNRSIADADRARSPSSDGRSSGGVSRHQSSATLLGAASSRRLGAEGDDEAPEEVTGTMRLQQLSALLPIYDLDTGAAFPDMTMIARFDAPPQRKMRIIGQGSNPVIALRMKPEHLQRLSELVLAFGLNTTSGLASAYREAKPFTITTVFGGKKAKDADDQASATAEGSSGDDDSSDDELDRALFGGGEGTTGGHLQPILAVGSADVDGTSSDDDDLDAALGLTPRRDSTARGGSCSHDATVPEAPARNANEVSGHVFEPVQPGACINPFRTLGTGLLPPRLPPRNLTAADDAKVTRLLQSRGLIGSEAQSYLNASTKTADDPSTGDGVTNRSLTTSVANAALPGAPGAPTVTSNTDDDGGNGAPDPRERLPVKLALAHREATSFSAEQVAEFMAEAERQRLADKAQDKADVGEVLRDARGKAKLLSELPAAALDTIAAHRNSEHVDPYTRRRLLERHQQQFGPTWRIPGDSTERGAGHESANERLRREEMERMEKIAARASADPFSVLDQDDAADAERRRQGGMRVAVGPPPPEDRKAAAHETNPAIATARSLKTAIAASKQTAVAAEASPKKNKKGARAAVPDAAAANSTMVRAGNMPRATWCL